MLEQKATAAFVRLEVMSTRGIRRLMCGVVAVLVGCTIVGSLCGPQVEESTISNITHVDCNKDPARKTVFVERRPTVWDRRWSLRVKFKRYLQTSKRGADGGNELPLNSTSQIIIRYALLGHRACNASEYSATRLKAAVPSNYTLRCEALGDTHKGATRHGLNQRCIVQEPIFDIPAMHTGASSTAGAAAAMQGPLAAAPTWEDDRWPYCIAVQLGADNCQEIGVDATTGQSFLRLRWTVLGNELESGFLGAFKGVCVILSLVLCCWFARNLRKLRPAQRSFEQRWVLRLSLTLVLFNDPLAAFSAQSFSALREYRPAVSVLTVMGQSTFWAVLFLFWLVIVDHIRLDASSDSGPVAGRTGPKMRTKRIFVVFFWLLYILVTCYNTRGQYTTDEDGGSAFDPSAYAFFEFCSYVVVAVYVLWLSSMLLWLVKVRELQSLPRRAQWLLGVSMIVCALAILGSVLMSQQIVRANMGEWVGFYVLFNLYVFILAYLHTPMVDGGERSARDVLDGEFGINSSLFSNDGDSADDEEEDVDLGLPVIELPPFVHHEGAKAVGEDVVMAGHALPATARAEQRRKENESEARRNAEMVLASLEQDMAADV